jgi:hypothetical protein
MLPSFLNSQQVRLFFPRLIYSHALLFQCTITFKQSELTLSYCMCLKVVQSMEVYDLAKYYPRPAGLTIYTLPYIL